MSWVGGAASWRSRRATSAAEPESDADSYESPEEVPLAEEGNRRNAGEAPMACTQEDHAHEGATLISEALYEAVLDIYTPSNEVKQKTGRLLLSSRGPGQYQLYEGLDLDDTLLEHAGHLQAAASTTDCVQFAERISATACHTRCGDKCSGACRVRAFVHAGPFGTDFYFGSRDDIELAILSRGASCDVYIWDELEHRTMRAVNKSLDALLETRPGLAMRATELRTVPGQVDAHTSRQPLGMTPTTLHSLCAWSLGVPRSFITAMLQNG